MLQCSPDGQRDARDAHQANNVAHGWLGVAENDRDDDQVNSRHHRVLQTNQHQP
jgi:hypothetical protein